MTAIADAALLVEAAAETEPRVATGRRVPAPLRPWRDPNPRLGWLITAVVVLVGGVVRFWAVGFPPEKIFDEAYYPTEAQELLRYGYEDNRGYMFIVHPPLGKWMIAFTSWIFGDNSTGWRVSTALAGTICVLLIARIARRMFRSNLLGGVAGLLLALEGVSVVLSRVAILDIFLQLSVLAAFGALVLDRDMVRRRLAVLFADGADLSDDVPTLGPRPWRLAAGILLGLACAVKWSALSFLLGFAVLSVLWDRGALKSAGVQHSWPWSIRRSWPGAAGSFVVASIAAYLLASTGWFVGENSWSRHWADTHSPSTHLHLLGLKIPFTWAWVPGPIRSLGAYTLDAYRFHEGLTSYHPYRSSPWSWLVMGRPVSMYYPTDPTGCGAKDCVRQVLLIGTPILWWAFIPALIWLAWHWVTTRDWRAGAVWMAFLAGWLVWFQDLKRTMFLFYMSPLIPFLILAVTLAIGTLLGPSRARDGEVVDRFGMTRRRRWAVVGVSAYLGLTIVDFAWMWPLYSGGLLTWAQWHAHMWLPSWV